MITTLKKGTVKYGYLLLIAAWLFTVSLIVAKYKSHSNSPEKVQQQLSNALIEKEKNFLSISNDSSFITKLLDKNSASPEKVTSTKYPFGISLYSANNENDFTLVYWNSNKYSITDEDLKKADGFYFVTYQNGNFELIKKTLLTKNGQIICVGIIPIHWHYFIENKYLNSSFPDFKNLENYYEISTSQKGLAIKNIDNQDLFKIQKKTEFIHTGYDWTTIALRTIAIVCLFIFLNSLALIIVQEITFTKGFLFLSASLLLLRLCSYFFPFPFDFNELPLFDPSIYASNFIHPSLGDLLINCVLFFWLISFFKFNNNQSTIQRKYPILPYLNLLVLTITTLFLVSVVKSLVLDSKISFDVSNFFSLNIFSVISFVILCLCVIIFYHFSHLLLKQVFANKIKLSIQLFTVAIFGLTFLSFKAGNSFILFNLIAIIWLMLYVVFINFRKKDIELPILKSSIFIFWVMYFAFSVALLVMYQNNYTELEQRKKWAEKLAEQTDPESENLLKIAATNFNETFLLQNFNRFGQEFSNKFIKDSLVNENFSGYLNKYDTRIYTFDSLYKPLYNDDSTTYAVIKTLILNRGKETSIADLYTYNSTNQKQGYLYEKTIVANSKTIGYLFVTVNPKRYKSEALYPELFRQVQDLNSDFNTNYSYAIYNNGKILNRFNDYNFPVSLTKKTLPQVKFEQQSNAAYSELWYNAGNGKVVIVARKKSPTLELITLFAYLFCTFLIVIAAYHIFFFLLQYKFKGSNIKEIFQFNIRTQIHATIIFISIFSFIIIGAATISFFIYRFNQSNEDRLSKSIQVMANEIEEKVKIVRSQLAFDDVLNMNDVGFGIDVEKKINEISEVHNVDVNFYNATGKLIASTQPYIYNKHLLNDRMEPNAFFELNDNKTARFIQSEKVAQFSYLSIYLPVNDDEGNTYAYLNIPYLNSQAELNQEISGFLATLINLNAFIFLLAGAIAYLATERITASFSLISEKMKAINLGKHNEAIEWNRNDEIGVLITEYNKMVQKLEESAESLAQSEREGAWREMARQVAHEIKNPLTPMKLSIQYLQKSIDNNSNNIKQLTNQVATTLIEQIEQLSKIAGDFSQFANIGNVQLNKFNVTDVIKSLVQLHSVQEKVTINWEFDETRSCFINADKVQISRMFSNLLLNAIEACETQNEAIINIKQAVQLNTIVITITDNGAGIDEAMQHKIFTPNFTTKSSGTGLGLAICKGIVEKANGSIHFVTNKNKGTSFIVTLPLIDA